MSTGTRTYKDAIEALNSLQTPFAVLEARRKAGIQPNVTLVEEMKDYLARIGYSPSDLNRLNIIHVAGTKGKGSTCAFAASILSQYQKTHGVPRKIGLFTSPHLIAVRDRIRIDSVPISEELFARAFFEIWDRLEATTPPSPPPTEGRDGDGHGMLDIDAPPPKPVYARFLTLLSWHVFLSEGVDAAVYETNLGGEYDATNVVPEPVVTGISMLGIDHVAVLGDTVEKIAWHKAGIMKRGSPAFTIEQVPGAAQVLAERAAEKGVQLKVLGIDPRLQGVGVRPSLKFQKQNASLAVALAETALRRLDPGFEPGKEVLAREFKDGLEKVEWRGRCEVKYEGRIAWYIDGAHTVDSLRIAAKWFVSETRVSNAPKALIFNQQGRAEAIDFLAALCKTVKNADGVGFQHVIFCTNVTYAQTGYKPDFVNLQYNPKEIENMTAQKAFAEKWLTLDPSANVTVASSIEDAINTVRNLSNAVEGGQNVQALITGSLHLVGGALGVLEGVDSL